MEKYKIKHDRPECIGCCACASINPERWEMDADSKSNIKKGKRLEDGTEEIEMDSEFESNLECAQSCPVNVIHIYKDGKKLI